MKKQTILILILCLGYINIRAQSFYCPDLNGDKIRDFVSINPTPTIERPNQVQFTFFQGSISLRFQYVSTCSFDKDGTTFRFADYNGDGRDNLIMFRDNYSYKEVWNYELLPTGVYYNNDYTAIANASGTIEHFANIDNDNKIELILIKDNSSGDKEIWVYKFISTPDYTGYAYITDSYLLMSGCSNMMVNFGDIDGDSRDDLILSRDNIGLNGKEIWTYLSNGASFAYRAYTFLPGDQRKNMYLTYLPGDNKIDLALTRNNSNGAKDIWHYISDGWRFNYSYYTQIGGASDFNLYFGLKGLFSNSLIGVENGIISYGYENVHTVSDKKYVYKDGSTSNLFFERAYKQYTSDLDKMDWENAGYNQGGGIPHLITNYIMPLPSTPSQNYDNLMDFINNNPGSSKVIEFTGGKYQFTDKIKLNSYIVLRGQGLCEESNGTVLEYISNSTDNDTYFIEIRGRQIGQAYDIEGYYENTNEVEVLGLTDFDQNDMVDIVFSNEGLPETHNNDNWYAGQVTHIQSVRINNNHTFLQLKDDFGLTWKTLKTEQNLVIIKKIIPITDVGIENMKIQYSGDDPVKNPNDCNQSSRGGALIGITNAYNCWVRNVQCYKCYKISIEIGTSKNIEIRENFINDAYSYGIGGHGYGIGLGRTSYCKIENNVLNSLRHAIMLNDSPSRNVIAYNYSHNSRCFDADCNVSNFTQGDLSIHGKLPFGNLFEGNYVDQIFIDQTWGISGPFNVFLRNHTVQTSIDQGDRSYFIGSNSPNCDGCEDKVYLSNYTYSLNDGTTFEYLPDISYVYPNSNFRPSFYPASMTYPSIGCLPVNHHNYTHTNPAKERMVCSFKSTSDDKPKLIKKENTTYEMKVHPNPVVDKLTLEFSGIADFQNTNILIYNMMGKMLLQKDITQKETELDFSKFESGLYILKINNNKNNEVKKILKK